MGGSQIANEKGGRKALDAALTLVPFIDLLSCCLAFLLMTAVWSTVSRMNVASPDGGHPIEKVAPQVVLTLSIQQDSFHFEQSPGESTVIPRTRADYDFARLGEVLHAAKTAFPHEDELHLQSDDRVLYEKVVETMDIALSAKFPKITFADRVGG